MRSLGIPNWDATFCNAHHELFALQDQGISAVYAGKQAAAAKDPKAHQTAAVYERFVKNMWDLQVIRIVVLCFITELCCSLFAESPCLVYHLFFLCSVAVC